MTNQDELGSRLDEAIAWRIRLSRDDAGEADWQAFASWLEADAANRQVFNQIEDLDGHLEVALVEREQATEPDAFGGFNPRRRESWRRSGARVWMAGALIAASLLVAFFVWRPMPPAIGYTTRVGEMRTVMLPDNTTLDIGARTRLVARVSKTYRHVNLLDGEVIFRVAKDSQHPFVVNVGDRDMRVVGTVFDLSLVEGVTTLAVAQGTVVVSPTAGTASGVTTVTSGEKLTYDDKTGATTVEQANPADAMAWHDGYLVYRNAPLSRVIDDLNRYFPEPIASEGSGVASMRFSGVLRLDSEQAVLKRISMFLPVKVSKGPEGRIVLRAAGSKP